jgi:hypothetical protein
LIRFVVGVGIAVFHSRTTVMPTPQPFNFHSHPVTPQPIYQPAAQRLSSTSRAIQPLPAPLSDESFRGFMASPPFHHWPSLVAVYAL